MSLGRNRGPPRHHSRRNATAFADYHRSEQPTAPFSGGIPRAEESRVAEPTSQPGRAVTTVPSPDDIHRLAAEMEAQRTTLSPAEAAKRRAARQAAIPRAIDPYYSLATPSAIFLYTGPLLFPSRHGGTEDQADCTVSLRLSPRPHVAVNGPARRLRDIQDLLDGVPTPQLPPMPALPPPPEGPIGGADSSWLPPLRGYIAGTAAAAKTVTFHLVNFTEMHGTPISDGINTWPGRVVVNVGPWIVTIDGRCGLREILATTNGRGGCAVTHTCRLERRDGRVFAFARCQHLLTCLTWCLWFCRSAAPAVIVPVGFDKNGRARWSRWAAPHTDPLPDTHWQWFDQLHGAEQLSMLLPLFFETWSDPAWQWWLQRTIRYYAEASVMGTLSATSSSRRWRSSHWPPLIGRICHSKCRLAGASRLPASRFDSCSCTSASRRRFRAPAPP